MATVEHSKRIALWTKQFPTVRTEFGAVVKCGGLVALGHCDFRHAEQ
jgi:hypothetical protein